MFTQVPSIVEFDAEVKLAQGAQYINPKKGEPQFSHLAFSQVLELSKTIHLFVQRHPESLLDTYPPTDKRFSSLNLQHVFDYCPAERRADYQFAKKRYFDSLANILFRLNHDQ